MISANVIWSDLIYVLGPISDKSNCFKLKKLIYPVLHVRLYFDDETIGMDRKVINASKHVYGSVCFCCCCCFFTWLKELEQRIIQYCMCDCILMLILNWMHREVITASTYTCIYSFFFLLLLLFFTHFWNLT